MAKIILVTGTPGVGKTLFVSLLARETRSCLLNLGEFVKKNRLHNGFDRSTGSYVIDERRLHKRLSHYFDAHVGEKLIVDTHSIGSSIPKRRKMVVVVIRLDPLLLARRLKARGWARRKIWDNVEAELIDLSLYESVKFVGRKRVYEIDATNKHPRQILNEVLRLLSKGGGRVGPPPDWLGRYDPIELLKRIA